MHRLTIALAVLGIAATGCVVDTTGGAQCTPDKNCVSNPDGTVQCEVGYRWEDEADVDNFNCVPDVPGSADGGS